MADSKTGTQPTAELKSLQHLVNWHGALQIIGQIVTIIVVLVLTCKPYCKEQGGPAPQAGSGQQVSAQFHLPGAVATAPSAAATSGSATNPTVSPPALTRWPFGGPYPFKESYQKILDFEQTRRLGFTFSEAAYITANNQDLFFDSIDANSQNDYGRELQRYDFVIERFEPDKRNWKIKVAVWRDDARLDALELKNSDGRPFNHAPGTMINFFPEETGDAAHYKTYSPFWISAVSSSGLKDTGILDALSKHFMLANVLAGDGIELFDRDVWLDAKVGYAGEILVDLRGNYYVLTNGSGTYQPDGNYLEAVARYFEEVLGVAPTYVQSPRPKPGAIRPYLTTGRTNIFATAPTPATP